MFRHEFFRLWNHRIVWLLLCVLLAVNGALFFRRYSSQGEAEKESVSYTAQEYRALWEKLEQYPKQSRKDVLLQWQKNINILQEYEWLGVPIEQICESYDPEGTGWVSELLNTYTRSPEEIMFTSSIFIEPFLLKVVMAEVQAVEEYPEYREEMVTRAELLMTNPLFMQDKDGDTYNMRNLEKTLADFSKADLPALTGVYGNSKGVESVVFPVTGFCCLVLFLYAAAELFIFEKERELEALVRTTARGKIPRLNRKLLALLLFAIIIGTLFFVENLLLAQYMFGIGDLSRPIQAVASYVSCVYRLSVGGYLLVLYGLWLLALSSCAVLIAACTAPVKSTPGNAFLVILLLGTECALFLTIGNTSRYAVWKFVNPIAMMSGDQVIAIYRNINLFGYPVSYPAVVLGLCALLIAVSYLVLAFYFERRYTEKTRRRIFWRRKKAREALPSYSVRLWQQEFYRQGILQKGFLLFPALLLLGIWWTVDTYEPTYAEMHSRYYQEYVERWRGELTEQTFREMEEESKRFEEIYEKIDALTQKQMELLVNGSEQEKQNVTFALTLLYSQLNPEPAFQAFCSYVDYLKEGGEGCVVDQRPFREMVIDLKKDIRLGLFLIIAYLALLPPVFAQDRTNKMIGVLGVTKKARRLLHFRLWYAGGIAVFVTAGVIGARYYAISKQYRIYPESLSYSAYSVEGLCDYTGWTLGQYLVYATLLRIVGACAFMLVLFLIIHLAEKTVVQWLLFAMLFVLPLITSIMYPQFSICCLPLCGILGSSYALLWAESVRWLLPMGILATGTVSAIVISRRFARL